MTPPQARSPRARDKRACSLQPPDRAVPQLPRLLQCERMAAAFQRCLSAGSSIEDVRVALVDYRPGSGCSVAYDVVVRGRRQVAVATTGDALRAQAARTDARRAIARALGRDATVARPLTYDVGLGALLHWYPLDLAMPVLARPVPELLRHVARSGIPVDPAAAARPLLYRPGQRAVIRAGDVVFKAYAEHTSFRAGLSGLRIATGLGLGPGPLGALADVRLIARAALDGEPVPRTGAGEMAPVAGAMLRVLHDADLPRLEPMRPRAMLEAAARGAALTASVAPAVARRARHLVARLEEHVPEHGTMVASHGDFNVGALLDLGGALAILDFDEACLAPAGFDVASYAAGVVSGRPGDLERADAALDALLAGYGERPADVDWYLAALLLCRSPRPFRRQERRWSERLEAMVAAAEEVLGR